MAATHRSNRGDGQNEAHRPPDRCVQLRAYSGQPWAEAGAAKLAESVARAPITGTISSMPISNGDVVGTGAELFSVVDLSTMELEAALSSDSLGNVSVGTPVEFQVQGFRDTTFMGRISRISPSVDPATNQIRVFAEIPNSSGRLVSGLYAEGRLATGPADALIVPSNAVQMRGDSAHVLAVENGVATRREVQVGRRDDQTGTVQVTGGLEEGQTALVGTARDLRPGARIEISDGSERASESANGSRPVPGDEGN